MIPVALAPLAGVTDKAFRQICKQFGADILTTEMVSAKGLYYKDKKTAELLSFDEEERPIGAQIFGSEPDIMAYSAAKIEETFHPSFIDINMGCPVPKIVGNGEGSALMKNPLLVSEIIKSVVNSVSIPVSVKMRAGFDKDHINAPEIARVAEEAGAFRVAVHGRTREQFYSGTSDNSVIASVKQSVHIPVFGNGDIFKPEDAEKMVRETGVDGIMIARGSLGNPFIFTQIKEYFTTGQYKTVSDEEKIRVALLQLEKMCSQKRECIAVPEARKHMAWYLKGMKYAAETKNDVFGAQTYVEMRDILLRYLDKRKGEQDA